MYRRFAMLATLVLGFHLALYTMIAGIPQYSEPGYGMPDGFGPSRMGMAAKLSPVHPAVYTGPRIAEDERRRAEHKAELHRQFAEFRAMSPEQRATVKAQRRAAWAATEVRVRQHDQEMRRMRETR